jgi:predicted PurR-regulated permease PerM
MVAAAVLVIVWFLWQARGALIPFIVGGVLAYMLAPLVERLARLFPFHRTRRELARTIAILVVYVTGFGVLFGLGALIIPIVVNEAIEFVDNIPGYVDQAREQSRVWTDIYRERVPEDVQARLERAVQDAGTSLGAYGEAMLSRTFGVLRNTFGLVFGYIIIPFWLFYILKDRHRIGPAIKNWFPPGLRGDVDACIGIVQRVLGSYIRAQLTLGLFIGVVTTVGLRLLGVEFWAILGIIAGITELIPIIGPILGALPALVVVLATEPEKFWWVLLFYVAVQQVENAVLVPRIQGSAVEVHPALIIVLLAIAQQIAGFGGMLIVVPLAAVARDIFKYIYRRLQEREAMEEDERVLRLKRPGRPSGRRGPPTTPDADHQPDAPARGERVAGD